MIRAPNKVLILDDNPVDAAWITQSLAALPNAEFQAQVHHSQLGIFPTSGDAEPGFSAILLAEGYAQTETLQMLRLLQSQFNATPVALLSATTASPQMLLQAARLGLFQVLDKDQLSRSALHASLLAMQEQSKAANAEQTLAQLARPSIIESLERERNSERIRNSIEAPIDDRTTMENTLADRLPVDSELSSQPAEGAARRRHSPNQANFAGILDELGTGVVKLKRSGNDFLITELNAAAGAHCGSDESAVGGSLETAGFIYQNLSLREALLELEASEGTIYQGVLQLDQDGNPNWIDVSIRDLGSNELIVEIYKSARKNEDVIALENGPRRAEAWRDLASSLPDFVALLDDRGQIAELISGEWQRLHSESSDPRGTAITALFPGEQGEQCKSLLNSALNTGKPQQTMLHFEQADQVLSLHATISLLRSGASTERFGILVARDVSAMQEQQDALQFELQRLRECARQAPFAAAIIGSDGRFEQVNPVFSQLTGLDAEDIIGKTELEIFPEQLAQELAILEQSAKESGTSTQAHLASNSEGQQNLFAKLPLPADNDQESPAICLMILPEAEKTAQSPSLPLPALDSTTPVWQEPSAEGIKPSAEGIEPSAEGIKPSAGQEPSAQDKEPSAFSGQPSAFYKQPSAFEEKKPSTPDESESATGKLWPERRADRESDRFPKGIAKPARNSTSQKKNPDSQTLSIEQLVSAIAADFNELMLSLSSSAKNAGDGPEDEDERTAQLQKLESVHEASRHAQELILKMFAYSEAESDGSKPADLSETSRRTLSLLEQSSRGALIIEASVDEDIFAEEHDVIEIQKLLIDMYRHLQTELTLDLDGVDTANSGRTMQAALGLGIQLDQRCVCCFHKIDGYYLEITLASGDHTSEPGQTVRNLSSELSEDEALVTNMLALHANVKPYNGHLMLNMGDDGSQSWRMLIPVAGNGVEGISLDNKHNPQAQRRLN